MVKVNEQAVVPLPCSIELLTMLVWITCFVIFTRAVPFRRALSEQSFLYQGTVSRKYAHEQCEVRATNAILS